MWTSYRNCRPSRGNVSVISREAGGWRRLKIIARHGRAAAASERAGQTNWQRYNRVSIELLWDAFHQRGDTWVQLPPELRLPKRHKAAMLNNVTDRGKWRQINRKQTQKGHKTILRQSLWCKSTARSHRVTTETQRVVALCPSQSDWSS